MSGYAVALLFSAVFALVVYVPFRFIFIARMRRETQRYPIFAVRDEFVRLKVAGAFDADPGLYDYYIEVCNGLVRNTRRVNLQSLLAALETLTPDNKKSALLIEERTAKAPAEVGIAVGHMCECVIRLLRENSILVRFVSSWPGRSLAGLLRNCRRTGTWDQVGRVSPREQRAVKEYREIRDKLGRNSVIA